jgi:hypothetical protein
MPGFFSWCSLLRRWDAKKQTKVAELEVLTQSPSQEPPLATVEVAAPDPVVKKLMEPESDEVSGLIHVVWTLMSICVQISSENTRAVVPSTTQYIVATGKQALALLQTAASVTPVPLVQDAIGVARRIIEVCEVRAILFTVA